MRGKRSEALFKECKEVNPRRREQPCTGFRRGGVPLFRGKGIREIYDVDGNSYIDYVLSWGPMILGHAFPRVVNPKGGRKGHELRRTDCAEIEIASCSKGISFHGSGSHGEFRH